MALRNSTGDRAAKATSFASVYNHAVFDVYTGNQPATADAAPTGTKLGTFSVGAADATNASNGFVFTANADGTVTKPSDAEWKMIGIAAGTVGWGRLRLTTDTGALSTTQLRKDFAIAVAGGEVQLSSVAVDIGTPISIDQFTLTFPM
jgi:hypothetical protein